MTSVYLTTADRNIVDSIVFKMFYLDDKQLEIQFPPKITADSRKVDFKIATNYQTDPIAIYAGNSPRDMTIKFEYIVEDDYSGNLKTWNIDRIKRNINYLKGLVTKVENLGNAKNPIVDVTKFAVLFCYPLITGPVPRTIRVNTVNVEYSDEMIITANDSDPSNIVSPGRVPGYVPGNRGINITSTSSELTDFISYPLKSTVTLNISTISVFKENKHWEKLSKMPVLEDLWF